MDLRAADGGSAGSRSTDVGAGGDLTHSDHVATNAAYWDANAPSRVAAGRASWAADEPRWGMFAIPQSQLPVLPDDVAGLDTVELGCGTGYVSAWLARRGARPVGLDVSAEQLATARALQAEHGLEYSLVHGDAEELPFPDRSFDLAISEYGAVTWCDPYRWIPEAARVLRPGGRLIFLRTAVLLSLCEPDEGPARDRLLRPLFGLHRLEWDDPEGRCIDFNVPHGEMVRLLASCGFAVEDLIEVQVPEGAQTSVPFVTAEWARQWPCEEVWFARLKG